VPTPDYHRIAQLERDLGIGQPETKPIASSVRPVCLIKDCAGSDYEIATWSGVVLRRIHEH
jgi:hypothetical protein